MKNIALLSLILSLSFLAKSQNMDSMQNPVPGDDLFTTPEVTAFQKYNMLKPNLYTGRLNVEIPIFKINSGNISVPISLTYNAAGVNIDEYASSIGLGWNLNAGGIIAKKVRGLADDSNVGIRFLSFLDSYGFTSVLDIWNLDDSPQFVLYTQLSEFNCVQAHYATRHNRWVVVEHIKNDK